MYATEFQTIVTNPYIQIPNFERFKNREVRIIILETRQFGHTLLESFLRELNL